MVEERRDSWGFPSDSAVRERALQCSLGALVVEVVVQCRPWDQRERARRLSREEKARRES